MMFLLQLDDDSFYLSYKVENITVMTLRFLTVSICLTKLETLH